MQVANRMNLPERQELQQKDGFMGRAVRRAMKAGLLAGYLSRKAKEIENMFFGEYDYATDVAERRKQARETARILKASGIDGMLIAKSTGLTQEEIAGL